MQAREVGAKCLSESNLDEAARAWDDSSEPEPQGHSSSMLPLSFREAASHAMADAADLYQFAHSSQFGSLARQAFFLNITSTFGLNPFSF